MKLFVLSTIFAAALSAADVSGSWRGTITTEMARQTTGGTIPAYMELKQSGGAVTGSAGANENLLFKLEEGKIEGDRLVVAASPKEGSVLRFLLTVKDNVLEGDVEENGRNIGTAKLTREK